MGKGIATFKPIVTSRLTATSKSPDRSRLDIHDVTVSMSSTAGTLSTTGGDWGTHRKRNSGRPGAVTEDIPDTHESGHVSCDTEVSGSSSRQSRRKELVRLKHSTLEGLAPDESKKQTGTLTSARYHCRKDIKAVHSPTSHRDVTYANVLDGVENSRGSVQSNLKNNVSAVRQPRTMNLVTRTDADKSSAALGTGAGADGVIGAGEGAAGVIGAVTFLHVAVV